MITNTIKKFIVLSSVVVSSIVLTSCGVSDEIIDAANTEDIKENELQEKEEETKVNLEELSDDFKNYLIDNEDIPEEEIISVNTDDFDRDGDYEAFIFVGECSEDDGSYLGDMWFTDGNECVKLEGSRTENWWSVNDKLSFENRAFVVASEYYATGGCSVIWSVYDDKPSESDFSRYGEVIISRDNENVPKKADNLIRVVDSTYDLEYDSQMKTTLGHTWKEYYFYYDPEKDDIFEYGGTAIKLDYVEQACGFDLIGQIKDKGYSVINAYYRDNGILNVNYFQDNDGIINFDNANYDCINKCFVNVTDEEETFENSGFGGYYKSAMAPGKAVYNKNYADDEITGKEHSGKNINITVDRPYYVVIFMDEAVLIGNTASGEGLETSGYVIDEKTKLQPENPEALSCFKPGMSALEWFYALHEDEYDDMCGVYDVVLSPEKHIDVIKGLYWWD